jgi:hypothetical protein
MFISVQDIDVMLISETHFTGKGYLKIPKHTVNHTSHPAGTVQEGIAIIIKSSIQNQQLSDYSQDFLQAISVTVEDTVRLLTISAVFLPLEDFYNTLGHRFIAGGDYNAKHTD